MLSPARRVAFDVLLRVENGAWAWEVLRAASERLDSRDAALATDLVFGTLRSQGQLDHLIRLRTGKAAARLDQEVRIALRLGFHQLRHLSRVPPHAAVAESVELVKRARKSSAAGLVNAVLRNEPERPAPEWPDEATMLSMPPWLLERWQRKYGEDKAHRIAASFLQPPEVYVRVPDASQLAKVRNEPTEVPGCYRVLEGDTAELRRQDISSQWVVTLLDLEPGQLFLDLCAAPGNKTAQALESGVRAVACDLHWKRLRQMKGLSCGLVVLDATQALPFRRKFDRILVDAPCSGTGTLGRNPEIKWRLRPEDLPDLHSRQVRILRNAINSLAPGGRLVYSTCSLEEEENEEVVREALGREADETLCRLPGIQPGDGFFAAVIRSD